MDLSDEVVEIVDRDSDSNQPPHGIDEVRNCKYPKLVVSLHIKNSFINLLGGE